MNLSLRRRRQQPPQPHTDIEALNTRNNNNNEELPTTRRISASLMMMMMYKYCKNAAIVIVFIGLLGILALTGYYIGIAISEFDLFAYLGGGFQINDSEVAIRFSNVKNVSFHAATSKTIVDDKHEYVMKIVSQSDKWKGRYPLEREICILKRLSPFSWAPRLVWYNSSSMVTSYAGKPLNLFNIPLNYREQYTTILRDMAYVGVTHGDIYKKCKNYRVPLCISAIEQLGETAEWYELTVQVNESKPGEYPPMSLLDFSWAQFHGSFSCNRHIADKGPSSKYYKPRDDVTVFERLDITFRRHLQLEQHLMVDWTSYFSEDRIRTLVKRWPNLYIRKVLHHPKYDDDSTRVQVFSKFYNTKLDDFRGKQGFIMYFLIDTNPKYEFRPSSKGNRIVNSAMFDLKRSLRDSMGGGFKVHATDNIQETKDNVRALRLDEYQHRHFDTLKRVFDVLNAANCKYVVLRNFEKMPHEVIVDPNHLDVDLLVSDYYEVKRILDGDSPQELLNTHYENGKYRIVNTVSIEGKGVNFDIRAVGDNYLDKKWQQDIIKRRVAFRAGIYVPSEEDHLFSIMYHAIIQKKTISDTYVKVMTSIGNFSVAQAQDKTFLRGELDSFMKRHGYNMVRPNDKTVGYFI